MRRELSSRITPLYRWVIPALLTIGAIVVIWRLGGIGMPGRPEPESVMLAIVISALLVILARIFDKGKRVWIDEESLIISDYLKEARINFSEIESIEVARFMKPDRVRVRFSRPTRFGNSIVFFPPFRWFKSSLRNPIAAELEQLAANAKSSNR
jgi:hypothetical protein